MNKLVIKKVILQDSKIIICYECIDYIEAWIENCNKHYPHIMSFNVDNERKLLSINISKLIHFIESFHNHTFKLSFCSNLSKKSYLVSNQINQYKIWNIKIYSENNLLFFSNNSTFDPKQTFNSQINTFAFQNKTFYKNQLPINVLDIGSCFSRSIFRSDDYFNPTYKKFFIVKETLFHNSFISLLSDPINYDFSNIEDLSKGDASKYIAIEFNKDIKRRLSSIDLLIVDNYVDATCPIIEYKENSFFTYNKYFSESIFKRFFSNREIIYPGELRHLFLYKNSIKKLKSLIEENNIENVVLLGGRLSKTIIDPHNNKEIMWEQKLEWIEEVNKNWNDIDSIFLDEISNAVYIDKRYSKWKSDPFSPIIGGASPSHYQSGYYKEIFSELCHLFGFYNYD